MRDTIGPVGPSTGWISGKIAPSFKEHVSILTKAKATAAEMVCHTTERTRSLTREHRSPLGDILKYVSIHLGSFLDFPQSPDLLTNDQRAYMEALQNVCENHKVSAASAHPDVIPSHIYPLLNAFNIPVAIENLDRLKKCGHLPYEIRSLGETHRLPYVIDTQHLYEIAHDRNMDITKLASEFADALGTNIAHLHVSGEFTHQGKQIVDHAQLPIATNRKEILKAVHAILERLEKPIPIILEGETLLTIPYDYQPHDQAEREELLVQSAEDIRRDIECIMNELHM